MSSLISLEKVSKYYQLGNNQIRALHEIDFHLNKGEMTAIVGASGSGKSTLMNIIGFLDKCTSGTYLFSHQNVSDLPEQSLASIRNQKIGFVFQSFFLLPRFNALQNVTLPLIYRGTPAEEAKEAAQYFLDKMAVGHLSAHKPYQLSGGQQQRVAIARALVGNPELILADEPTGALDSQTGNEVMDLFTQLNQQEGRSIIIITHDKEVSKRCQRVVTIKDGCMV